MAVGLGIAELCRKWWCHLDRHSCGRVSMGDLLGLQNALQTGKCSYEIRTYLQAKDKNQKHCFQELIVGTDKV